MINPTIQISGRAIGQGQPTYVVAEIGINHGGDLKTAELLLQAAKEAGADAGKLQAFVPEEFLARGSPYFDLLAGCALDRTAVARLLEVARDIDLTLFSAVFDEPSADLLNDLNAPAFKIASGDLTHLPLLRHVARFDKPMLISTGGGTMEEVVSAMEAIRGVNSSVPVAVFHCVSNYPTEAQEANLACMATMRQTLGVPVGFSDHTAGNGVPVAAAALGADIIEKHFTLDRNSDGPDHALSADPDAFRALVQMVRDASSAVGSAVKQPVEASDFIPQIRRSVTARAPIAAGTPITREMLAVKRPGTGIAPDDITRIVGRSAARDIAADETMQWSDLRPS